jgi:hypothetical protein
MAFSHTRAASISITIAQINFQLVGMEMEAKRMEKGLPWLQTFNFNIQAERPRNWFSF